MRRFWLSIIPLTFLFPNVVFAQDNPEKDILSSAIKIYASISPDEDIKTRLRKHELTIRKIDEILDDFSSTDTGLELLSTGKFGKFNTQKVRKEYLNDLISFNLKTCESSPSFACLGFISLNNGTQECSNPKEFSQYLSASNNFKNAYRIFKSQGDSKKHELGVLSAYRECAKQAPGAFGKDFINSRLVGILLANGDESKAVGITQKMSTPLFKLLSAADIRVTQNKYDYPTYKKIVTKAKDLNNELDREISILSLTNKLYDVGLDPFSQQAKSNKISFALDQQGGYGSKCNAQAEFRSELAMDFLFRAAESSGGILGFSGTIQNTPNVADVGNYSQALPLAIQRAESCSNYFADPILYFAKTNPKFALALREFQSSRGNSQQLGSDFFKNVLSNAEIIAYAENRNKSYEAVQDSLKNFSYMKDTDMSKMEPWKKFRYPYAGKYGQNSLFKVYVDTGDVCSASSKLFRELRGSEYEVEAVSYFIESPNISVDKKYDCGDAELDLLIN